MDALCGIKLSKALWMQNRISIYIHCTISWPASVLLTRLIITVLLLISGDVELNPGPKIQTGKILSCIVCFVSFSLCQYVCLFFFLMRVCLHTHYSKGEISKCTVYLYVLGILNIVIVNLLDLVTLS